MDISRNKGYSVLEKNVIRIPKKELKWGHLDISRNMKEILKNNNNTGYRKIELVKRVDSWDILIKINYIKIKRNITDIEEKNT